MYRNRLTLCVPMIVTILLVVATSADAQISECGTLITPAEAVQLQQLEPLYQNAPPAAAGGEPSWVPITFHVIRRSDGTGGLSADSVCEGMDDMNNTYFGAGIQFFLGGPIDYIDSDAFYTINTLAEINLMRNTNRVADTINIYSTPNLSYEGGGLCGISAFTTSSVQAIAMRNSCMPPGNNSTLSHEVGHFFNLYHTHETAFGSELVNGSNCTVAGDVVCDTPADPRLGSSTVSPEPNCVYTGGATDSNGDLYTPDPKNLMSYSRKQCRIYFAAGQLSRANTTMVNLRPNLINSTLPPIASECSCAVTVDTDVNNDGSTNIFDILCVLDGFVNDFSNCTLADLDIACPSNGVINIFDILAVLDGFAGTPPCACGT